GAMTLYAHLPGKGELIDLMVDRVFGEVEYSSPPVAAHWRAATEAVADQNRRLLEAHPWLIDVDTSRPPLGPGTIAKYDAELGALIDTGLDDVEIDQALSLLLDHVRSTARQSVSTNRSVRTADSDWWGQAGPALAGVLDAGAFPL